MSDAGPPPPGVPPPPPPGAPPPPPPPGWAPSPAAGQWYSLRGLTTALTVLLWLAAAAGVFGAIAFFNRISFLNDLIDNGRFGVDNALDRRDSTDGLVGGAVVLMGLLSLAIVILVIIWTYRAMKNNELLGRRARFTSGWAIAGWLIPLVNLVIPVLIFQDLWRGSDPSVPAGQSAAEVRGSALVGWWWAAYVLSGARFGGFGGDAHLNDESELRDLRTSDTIGAIGGIASVVAAILAIQVIRTIADRQEECARLAIGGAPAAG